MQQGSRTQGWLLLLGAIVLMIGGMWLIIRGGLALRILGVLGVCAWGVLVTWAMRLIKQETQAMRPVDRRYLREFTPLMAVYMLIMVFVWPHVDDVHELWLKMVFALAPVLPIALTIFAMVRYIIHSDEFQRRLHLEALAIASGVVGAVSLALGFMVAAKIIAISGAWVLLMTFPALCAIYGLGRCVLAWRYRNQ